MNTMLVETCSIKDFYNSSSAWPVFFCLVCWPIPFLDPQRASATQLDLSLFNQCTSDPSVALTMNTFPDVHITRRSRTPRLTVVSVMERPQSRSQPIMLRVPLHIIQRWINSAQQLHGDCILRCAAATVALAVVGSHEIGQDGSAFQRKSWEWCEQTTQTSPRSQLMLSAERTWPAGTWIQRLSSSLTSWQIIMVFTAWAMFSWIS